ncbi:alpha/beta fold hydrolase [uncultured Sphaerochaeta sp.]|uniref:alpha/beta hydrolase n=1 Tax=uncultured Sphaerochaeta sp. TaxID=886478 RepID=UPI002A0A3358|nr:alpha/beta fold hydrolase [uncultured Sphaerochaeta sp.]
MWLIIIFSILVLDILWNTFLWGYKDRNITDIESDDAACFCEEAKSITLKGNNTKAIILVHGYPSSPRMYEYSAKRFFEAGYDVYVPLLPGFGTDVKEFEKTNFTQWFNYLCRYYEKIRADYPTVFVLGTSMGGLMTLKLGELYCNTPKAPNALVSIAAPVVYNSIRDHIITDWRFSFMRTIALFKPTFAAKTVKGNPKSEDGNELWTGYSGLFIKQGISLVHAMPPVRKDLGKITCPLFAIQDVGDKTVPFGNLKIIQKENKSTDFKTLETKMGNFNHTHHALLLYRSIQGELTDTILDFLKDKE